MRTHATWLSSTAAGLLLAACGGGGDSPPPPATTYAVSAAQRHLLADTRTWTTTGNAPGGSFTLTMAVASQASAPFPLDGNGASRSKQTFTLQQPGAAPAVFGPTYYFDNTSLAMVGSDNGDGTCSIATQNTALPNTASMAATGAYFVLSDLDACIGGSGAVGSTTASWSLETDTGVVLLCWNSTAKDSAGAINGTLSTCIEVAADGALGAKARITITALGISITTRNF